MAKVKDLLSEMAHARKSEGINVIFDRSSPASIRSRSRSRSGSHSSSSNGSSSSLSNRGRGCYRGRYRSSSSSRSSNSRSRSHPRCHRRFSCCRCETHSRKSNGHHRRSPSRRHKVRYQSDSCSPSPTRSSQRRNDRSRYRSSRRESRHRRVERETERRVSRSPSRTDRSPSQSPQSSASLSLEDKKEVLQAAKANAMMLSSETSNLPESVKPLSPELPMSTWELPEELQTRVRQGPKKSPSQSDDSDPEDTPSPQIATQRKTISFSINNSVAKPTAAAPSSSRVTARADSYESRQPYGHWMPVKSGRKRKHTLAVSR